MEQIPEFTEGLDQSFSEKRWLDVAAIAHKAKSSVISMGMEELGNNDLKNLELAAKELHVKSLQKKANPSPEEEKEAKQLERNLQGYEKERQEWVKTNASPEVIASIIKKFKDTLQQAEEELKTETDK
ncbi:Hpt domain-containing protein [Marinilabilia sp.]